MLQQALLLSHRAIEERRAFSVDVERTTADGEAHHFTASFRHVASPAPVLPA